MNKPLPCEDLLNAWIEQFAKLSKEFRCVIYPFVTVESALPKTIECVLEFEQRNDWFLRVAVLMSHASNALTDRSVASFKFVCEWAVDYELHYAVHKAAVGVVGETFDWVWLRQCQLGEMRQLILSFVVVAVYFHSPMASDQFNNN